MKRCFCIICSLVILVLPGLCSCETSMQFLHTPIIQVFNDKSAQEICESKDLRALVPVALQMALFLQLQHYDGYYDMNTMCIGYNEECFYAVSAFSKTQRAVYELDTEYQICKYRIEDDADMSQNEMVCKSLCPENYWALDSKEVESAVYTLMTSMKQQ